MYKNCAIVHGDPFAVVFSVGSEWVDVSLASYIVVHFVGNGVDLCVASSFGDDHVFDGCFGDVSEVDGEDVLSFFVSYAFDDVLDQLCCGYFFFIHREVCY